MPGSSAAAGASRTWLLDHPVDATPLHDPLCPLADGRCADDPIWTASGGRTLATLPHVVDDEAPTQDVSATCTRCGLECLCPDFEAVRRDERRAIEARLRTSGVARWIGAAHWDAIIGCVRGPVRPTK